MGEQLAARISPASEVFMLQCRIAESQASLTATLERAESMTKAQARRLFATAHASWAPVSSATHLRTRRVIAEGSPAQIVSEDIVERDFDQPC
ncbi:hypothetical protein [Bosea rubneri]|uniref:Uncharacterized protein n=1 Tax=Bosea rubneri TaxID=3075434 RepID=A0ABU3SCA1_9HYPH|nr:hypothetical protein [Bosea sp. ZW T0_25]MDU0342400.1 hypothetical protein [Bosea sp. ZW T0_25]